MTKYSDAQIRKLTISFQEIDYSQPGAHEVFRDLARTLENFMTNLDSVTEREYWFFKLGRIANIKKWEFNNIPPVQFIVKEKQGEKEA